MLLTELAFISLSRSPPEFIGSNSQKRIARLETIRSETLSLLMALLFSDIPTKKYNKSYESFRCFDLPDFSFFCQSTY